MQSLSLVDAVARLLTDRRLREHFEQDPRAVADRIGIEAESYLEFTRLDASSIARQAEGLIEKRLQEVISMAPKTTNKLSNNLRELFQFYAEKYWPTGHRRHSLDAMHFLEFLARNRVVPIDRDELRQVQRASRARDRGLLGWIRTYV